MVLTVALQSFIFRDREDDVTARQVRAYGAVAPKVVDRKSSLRSLQLSVNRQDTLPTYTSHTSSPRPNSLRNAMRIPLKSSAPTEDRHEFLSRNGNEPDLANPNKAYHPAMHSHSHSHTDMV